MDTNILRCKSDGMQESMYESLNHQAKSDAKKDRPGNVSTSVGMALTKNRTKQVRTLTGLEYAQEIVLFSISLK